MIECWEEEDDVISKLLDYKVNDASTPYNDESYIKSLQDELLEIGEYVPNDLQGECESSVVHDFISVDDEESTRETIPNKMVKAGFKLENVMLEFLEISGIMDREISQYVAKEQKESMTSKAEGKIDVLKELLVDQHNKMQKLEEENEKRVKALEEEYKKKNDSLQNNLDQQKEAHEELQKEFNKILDKKEHEIENLTAENIDLTNALKENDSHKIVMENEELEGQLEVKDDYIGLLRLQITNLEKQHQQDEWKIEQGDDLLEMVENERDEMEVKYKAVISNMLQKLKVGASSTFAKKAGKCLDGTKIKPSSHTDVQQRGTEKTAIKPKRPPPGFEHIKPFINKKSHLSNSTTIKSFKQPVQKSAAQNVALMRVRKLPAVLKSLGWSDAFLHRKN